MKRKRDSRGRFLSGPGGESNTGAYLLAGGIFAVMAAGLYFMLRGESA